MNIKFACNLHFMFTEYCRFTERYQIAKYTGFKAVESGFPFGYPLEQVVQAKKDASIKQVLINVFTGDVSKGELGFAALPNREEDFKNSIELTITYAHALDCPSIHVMSGVVVNPTPDNDSIYEANIRWAVDRFKTEGILGLIEPINGHTAPNYYMNSFDKGLELVKKINSPHLKLIFDIFHLQQIKGNITRIIRENFQYLGHVQIAQVPCRNEPNAPGEVNYKYILSLLQQLGYNGYVGLEYLPDINTDYGLRWINEFGYLL